jgi:hypothetical protein
MDLMLGSCYPAGQFMKQGLPLTGALIVSCCGACAATIARYNFNIRGPDNNANTGTNGNGLALVKD